MVECLEESNWSEHAVNENSVVIVISEYEDVELRIVVTECSFKVWTSTPDDYVV